MTATVLDVIWCFDCAIRRDLVASTALSPFAVKLSERDMLDLASSTYTSCDSLDLIRILPYPLRRSIDQRYSITSSARSSSECGMVRALGHTTFANRLSVRAGTKTDLVGWLFGNSS
jgi:hypothetical protein